jgi:hypothetical protein
MKVSKSPAKARSKGGECLAKHCTVVPDALTKEILGAGFDGASWPKEGYIRPANYCMTSAGELPAQATALRGMFSGAKLKFWGSELSKQCRISSENP